MTGGRTQTETERRAADTRWEKRRAMGRRAFVWRYGVLGWGLPAALLTIAYAFIREQGFRWSADTASPRLRAGIVIILVLFPLLGHLLGGHLWDARERRRAERRGH
ncbi:MAG TPA: hypothetical protein VJL28_03805 [Gemmatimonadaceae bacterium]|nr:hypothetical protein [Gemmatimonadaceae bacterium]